MVKKSSSKFNSKSKAKPKKKATLTKAQVKSFMGAVMNREVSEIEGTKDTKKQRRAGL